MYLKQAEHIFKQHGCNRFFIVHDSTAKEYEQYANGNFESHEPTWRAEEILRIFDDIAQNKVLREQLWSTRSKRIQNREAGDAHA